MVGDDLWNSTALGEPKLTDFLTDEIATEYWISVFGLNLRDDKQLRNSFVADSGSFAAGEEISIATTSRDGERR